jgi:hypothetical protein
VRVRVRVRVIVSPFEKGGLRGIFPLTLTLSLQGRED